MKQYIIVENHPNNLDNMINSADNLSNNAELNNVVIMDKSILMKLYDSLKSVDTSRIVRDFRNKFNYHQHMSMEEYTKIITDEYEWLSFKEKIKEFKIAEQECTDTTVEEIKETGYEPEYGVGNINNSDCIPLPDNSHPINA
jgi:hypothetical protein